MDVTFTALTVINLLLICNQLQNMFAAFILCENAFPLHLNEYDLTIKLSFTRHGRGSGTNLH